MNAVKNGSKHWVELNDIGYSYNLNCDLVKLFECKGFVINPDYENFAILTEYQVWKMTENNKKLFDSVCRKCYPCGSKINTLRDEWLYATSRNEDIKNPKQDIEVSLFDNRLTMAEGKHRICLCKRLNYKEILVSILPNGHSCQYKTKTLQPQEPLYYKKHPWYKVKDEFYKFYKEKLNLERDDLKEIYVDSKLEDFIINLEKLSNKDILEILQIEKN